MKCDPLYQNDSRLEDRNFLLDQQGPRKMELGNPDNKYNEAYINPLKKKEDMEKKQNEWINEQKRLSFEKGDENLN